MGQKDMKECLLKVTFDLSTKDPAEILRVNRRREKTWGKGFKARWKPQSRWGGHMY